MKKFLSFLLALSVAFTIMPATVLAHESKNTLTLTKKATPVAGDPYSFDINLKIEGQDTSTVKPANVVIVMDASNSMANNNRMTNAKKAAKSMVNQLLFGAASKTKVALVAFGDEADTLVRLESYSKKDNLISAIDSLDYEGGTNIQDGMYEARKLLKNKTNPYIILLSDGAPTYSYRADHETSAEEYSGLEHHKFRLTKFNYNRLCKGTGMSYEYIRSYDIHSKTWHWEEGFLGYYKVWDWEYKVSDNGIPTISEAIIAKNEGCKIYSVGLDIGRDSNAKYVMKNCASGNGYYYSAGAGELNSVFEEIAGKICPAAKDGIVTDPMGEYFDLVAGTVRTSNGVAPNISGETLKWSAGTIAQGAPVTMSYRVTVPDDKKAAVNRNPDTMRYPTNGTTTLSYKDFSGASKTANFDVPQVPLPKQRGNLVVTHKIGDAGAVKDTAQSKNDVVLGSSITVNAKPSTELNGYTLSEIRVNNQHKSPAQSIDVSIEAPVTTVEFIYTRKTDLSVTVKYVDAATKTEIAKSETLTGAFETAYTVQKKTIQNYKFKQIVDPNNGKFVDPSATVYVEYDKICRVIYDGNGSTGGTIPVDSTEYKSGDTAFIQSGEPSKTGSEFVGWKRAGSDTLYLAVGANNSFTMPNDNVTLTAQWTSSSYTLTVKHDYGTGNPLNQTTKDAVLTLYSAPIRETALNESGYTLSGITGADGFIVENGIVTGSMPDHNVTITFMYASNSDTPYQVLHFKQNTNGTYPNTASVTLNRSGVTGTMATVDTTVYEGYTYDEQNPNNVTSAIILGNGSTILKRYYKINRYSVTFLAGEHGTLPNGRSEMVYSNIAHGTTFANAQIVQPEVTANDTWQFTGWNSQIPAGETEITQNYTFTAQYEQEKHKVTFLAGEHGTLPDGRSEVIFSDIAHGTTFAGAQIVQPEVTANDTWQFTGWNPQIPTGETEITENYTFTAQYERIQEKHKVTFLAGEHGALPDGKSEVIFSDIAHGTTFAAAQILPPEVTPHDSWQFTGWNPQIPAGETEITENYTFTAQYAPKTAVTHMVTFEFFGDVPVNVALPGLQNVPDGEKAADPLTASTITHTFNGWYTSPDSGTVYDFNTPITSPITIYGKWTENEEPESPIEVLVKRIFYHNGSQERQEETIVNVSSVKPVSIRDLIGSFSPYSAASTVIIERTRIEPVPTLAPDNVQAANGVSSSEVSSSEVSSSEVSSSEVSSSEVSSSEVSSSEVSSSEVSSSEVSSSEVSSSEVSSSEVSSSEVSSSEVSSSEVSSSEDSSGQETSAPMKAIIKTLSAIVSGDGTDSSSTESEQESSSEISESSESAESSSTASQAKTLAVSSDVELPPKTETIELNADESYQFETGFTYKITIKYYRTTGGNHNHDDDDDDGGTGTIIVDKPVPLAPRPKKLVTIVDESVPLKNLPVTGGTTAGTAGSFGILSLLVGAVLKLFKKPE